MRIRTLSVTEVNNYLKRILINDPILNNLVIKGEISNFKLHSSGHAYFSIKDENSKLKCVMFNREFSSLDFLPKDGMKVVIKGYISVYERNGDYQLYVSDMKKEGLGDLYAAFEKLKKELEEKGYFNPDNKKQIPFFPKRIGVVTSPTGAAIRDIISVITRRNNYVDMLIYPSLVQGENAAENIAKGIIKLNDIKDIDLIIIGRGGGSIEELWAFNEKIVADAIYNSDKPIISAVGHETDFTIADFVADLRAPTPSAAGELSVPDLEDVGNYLMHLYSNLKFYTKNKIDYLKEYTNNYGEERLSTYLSYKIKENQQTLDHLYNNLNSVLNNKMSIFKESLGLIGEKLNALSPLATLSRGYSITQNHRNQRIITSINDINVNDSIDILFSDGKAKCTVDYIKKGEVKFGGKQRFEE